ncbi:hypothetical protein [Criblamydia sequanensis]|uniref:Conserved putative secreted protein n=1 Tax=Candidatus Criblamydia sequanensis CRIB-18 TaxID=1437425 RepID=A0A090CYZ5_9BACT|nr:hypothetical protein [Criblamydia sequanensis]CDR34042.1 Conserved putative secreted protein [Criblamydia sequanensis CRIB-18]
MNNRNRWLTTVLMTALVTYGTTYADDYRHDEAQEKQERCENALSLKNTMKRALMCSQGDHCCEDHNTDEDHIPVGTRSLPHSEWVHIQELRAKMAFQRKSLELSHETEETESEDAATLEEIRIPEGELEISPIEELVTLGQEKVADEINKDNLEDESVPKEEVLAARATYYTSHQGVFYRPVAVTAFGDQVTLVDGSIWNVRWEHRYKTLDWLVSDTILVLPNHSWFSAYQFRLVNQNTGADAEVNLALGPLYNGIYTRWIIAIDYFNREICLDDGSIWRISPADDLVLKKWVVNDTVILGINDSWFSSHPNILLNVNMLNYACGTCENGF